MFIQYYLCKIFCACFSIAEENVTKATTVVFGGIEGKSLPFPPDEPNACKDQGITCPMVAGKEYKFKTALPVKSYYPKVHTNLHFYF